MVMFLLGVGKFYFVIGCGFINIYKILIWVDLIVNLIYKIIVNWNIKIFVKK